MSRGPDGGCRRGHPPGRPLAAGCDGRVGWFDDDQGKWVMWRPGRGRPAPARRAGTGVGGRPGVAEPAPLAERLPAGADRRWPWRRSSSPSSRSCGRRATPVKAGGDGRRPSCSASAWPRTAPSRPPEVLGHARRRATRPRAAVKVVQVVPTTPGSTPTCPAGTTGLEMAYTGVPLPPRRVRPAAAPAGALGRQSRSAKSGPAADVAQLVEHHLAKVRVAGSNPVVRSKKVLGRGSGSFRRRGPISRSLSGSHGKRSRSAFSTSLWTWIPAAAQKKNWVIRLFPSIGAIRSW